MSERKKILITTDFAAPHRNGVAHVVAQVARALSAYDITILTYQQPGMPEREQQGNVTTVRLDGKRFLGDTLRLPLKLPSLPEHDLVITNTRFFTLSAVGMRLARKWRVPHIHLEHGNRHVPHHNPLVRAGAWAYDHSIGRAVVTSATVVVCIARAGLPFARRLGARRVELIPNGIDPTAFAATPSASRRLRETLGIASTQTLVLYVGRLVREKGVHDLIKAISALPNKESYVLVAVGAGPVRAYFETQASKLGVHLQFAGTVDPAQLPVYYKAADVFVNPSWAEGLPTTVLEALAAGTPVIATAVGGTPEMLPRPSLVPAHSPSALTEALAHLEQLPKSTVPPRFTLGAMDDAWRTLVASLLQIPLAPSTAARKLKASVALPRKRTHTTKRKTAAASRRRLR